MDTLFDNAVVVSAMITVTSVSGKKNDVFV